MPRTRSGAIHPAWIVALVTTVTLLAASAFRSSTGVLIQPIMDDTGWSMETISGAAALNLVLYGIATPFTAAIMQTWGVRRTVVISMVVVGLASAATTLITAPWQLWLLWGVFIGLGTGALALGSRSSGTSSPASSPPPPPQVRCCSSP